MFLFLSYFSGHPLLRENCLLCLSVLMYKTQSLRIVRKGIRSGAESICIKHSVLRLSFHKRHSWCMKQCHSRWCFNKHCGPDSFILKPRDVLGSLKITFCGAHGAARWHDQSQGHASTGHVLCYLCHVLVSLLICYFLALSGLVLTLPPLHFCLFFLPSACHVILGFGTLVGIRDPRYQV